MTDPTGARAPHDPDVSARKHRTLEAPAAAPRPTRPRPDRAILEDRYDGLLGADGLDATKLWHRLHDALERLYEGTARRRWTGELASSGDGSGSVTDEALGLLREHLIR